VKEMKKMLVFLLVVGILMIGTLSMVDDTQENPIQEYKDFSDPEDFGDSGSYIINGGGQGGGGGGDAPG
jgi:hypothetical protein